MTYWSRGGTTDLDNLALVCPRHHTDVHSGTWVLSIIDDIAWATPASWIDPQRQRQRNLTHHHATTAARTGTQLALLRRPARGNEDSARPPPE